LLRLNVIEAPLANNTRNRKIIAGKLQVEQAMDLAAFGAPSRGR
jgi:hypothetical protein